MIDFRKETGTRAAAEKNGRRALVLDCAELRSIGTLPAPYTGVVTGWDEMIRTVPHEPPSTVAIIHPLRDGSPDPRVRELIAAAPLVPVLAVIPFQPEHADGMKTLYAWGVADLADTPFESRAIAPRLQSVHAQPFKRLLEPHLSRFVSMYALTLIRAAAGVTVDRGAATDLARIFGAGERTVAGWCARSSLPPPRRLLAWLRLLLALALLDTPGRTVVQAARLAGYHDQSLRRAVRELLGAGIRPRPGEFANAAMAFNAELREYRERAREARRGTRPP
ncbi:MAG TPA: helix-turn-helix domain-containing protein [Longimicrobium sp.]|nr:helix-turn-helix domain-containing protein [Longimicrobium sp.]